MNNPEAHRENENFLTPEHLQKLSAYFENPKFATALVKKTRQQLMRNPGLEAFFSMAGTFVEPVDRVTGTDDNFLVARAFINGSALGIGTARLIHPQLRPKHILTLARLYEIDRMPESEDRLETRHQIGAFIMEEGRQSFAKYPGLEELVDSFVDRVNPMVNTQMHFKSGVGYGFLLAHGAVTMIEQEKRAGELRDMYRELEEKGIDWDEELRKLQT